MYCVLSYVSASVTSSLALICATSFEKIEVFCFVFLQLFQMATTIISVFFLISKVN